MLLRTTHKGGSGEDQIIFIYDTPICSLALDDNSAPRCVSRATMNRRWIYLYVYVGCRFRVDLKRTNFSKIGCPIFCVSVDFVVTCSSFDKGTENLFCMQIDKEIRNAILITDLYR
jgi:hypothetical protein